MNHIAADYEQVFRRILERSLRWLVLRRRLPGEFENAVLYVSPAAALRYVFRPMANIDPPLLMAARRLVRSNDVIWDIGANVGLFSLAAAVRAGEQGQVIAFEPDAWIAQLLRRYGSKDAIAPSTMNFIATLI